MLQLARQPGVPSRDTIWAEDGAVFLTEALRGPPRDTIFRPHAGYLQVVPRLAAAIVSPLPVPQAALAISLIAALVVAILSVFVFWASGSAGLVRNGSARAALAAIVVLLPAAAFETNVTLANLHWYLIFTAFWALLGRPRSLAGWCICVAVVVMAVLSDPLAVLLLPVVAWRLWTSRSARSLALTSAFVASAIVQLSVVLTAGAPAPFAERQPGDIPATYGLRVAASALLGDRYLDELYGRLGLLLPLGCLSLVAGVLGYGVLRRGASMAVISTFAGASVTYWAVEVMLRGTGGYLTRVPFTLNGSRYTVLPLLFLLAAFVYVFDPRPRFRNDEPAARSDPRTASVDVPQLVASGLLAATVLLGFSGVNVRSAGPSWAAEIADARARCLTPPAPGFPGKPDGFAVARPGEVLVRIAPPLEVPFFRAAVPCERLLGP